MKEWINVGLNEEYRGQVSPSTNPFMDKHGSQAMGMQEHKPTKLA